VREKGKGGLGGEDPKRKQRNAMIQFHDLKEQSKKKSRKKEKEIALQSVPIA
jgi:hypothetical protein